MKRLAEGAPYLTFFGPASVANEDAARSASGDTRDERTHGARHRRHPRHRARHRARARARRLEPRARRHAARVGRRGRSRRAASGRTGRPLRRGRSLERATIARVSSRKPAVTAAARSTRSSTTPAARRASEPTSSTRQKRASTRSLRTNLQGPYFLTQAIARDQVERRRADPAFRASIVFITSVSAEMASINRGEYCVSKAGLSMAARLFAVRLAPDGHPGLRGPAGHHRDRHDRRRSRRLRPAHRGRPRPRTPLGPPRGRRPSRRRAAARRRAVRDRHRHPRRRRAVDSAACRDSSGQLLCSQRQPVHDRRPAAASTAIRQEHVDDERLRRPARRRSRSAREIGHGHPEQRRRSRVLPVQAPTASTAISGCRRRCRTAPARRPRQCGSPPPRVDTCQRAPVAGNGSTNTSGLPDSSDM